MRKTNHLLTLLCLTILTITLNAQVVPKHGNLQVIGTQLCNQHGEPIVLKGISSFWLNWDDKEFANAKSIEWLRDSWNMQLFRAAVAVEHENGYYENPALMLRRVDEIVRACIELGIYVIIDYHSHSAHENLAKAVEFFDLMARQYGQYPNVIYEIYNEPLRVNWEEIKPYHEAVVGAIRQHDPDNIIILGTPYWSQNVDEASEDPVQGSNLMYTLHFYAGTHGEPLRQKAEVAMRNGIAIFVTEWGGSDATGGSNMKIFPDETKQWLDWMDRHRISWAAWNLHDKEESCAILKEGAPVNGGWTDEYLKGHAFIVRDALLKGSK